MPVRESIGGAYVPTENPAFVLVDVNGVPASVGGGGGGGSGLSQAQTRDAVRDGVNLSTADAIPVTFNIVGGATGVQGVWNVSANTVRQIGTATAIAVGTANGNATSLALTSGGGAGTNLQSHDWIVVANGGDTASGLARYAIAREFVTEDASGTVTAPFWTNSADTVITAPARTNLVRAEVGYPPPIPVKYALNNAPTVFLNGYAVRLPNNVIELYSNYNLSTLVTQGTGATEAIAGSIIQTDLRVEENTTLPRTPTILWHTFTATRTERVFNLVNARNWAIANNGGVPIQYSYSTNATTQTPFYMGIPPSVQIFPVSGQNYTGPLAISVDRLPTPVNLLNGTTVSGTDTVTFAAALPEDQVVPRQMITGTGIPANTFIKNWNSTRTIISLCDATGAAVNATSNNTGTYQSSGAPVLIEVWN